MMLPQSRLSRLTLASLATLLSAVTAHADPVLTATTGATAGSLVATPNVFSSTNYVNSNSSIGNALGDGSAYSFSNANGAYAVNARAAGKATGSALSSFKFSYTNDTGLAKFYSLSFHIYAGYISTYTNTGLSSGESLSVNYKASVKTKVGTGPVMESFNSEAALTQTDAGYSLIRSGTNLVGSNTDVSDGNYSWSNEYYNVDLGVVAAGASFEVVAEVQNMAFADVGTYSFSGGGGGYEGYYCNYPTRETEGSTQSVSENECSGFKGSASSFYGDPFSFDGSGAAALANQFVLTGTNVNDLPEPAGLLLVGAGLAAAAAARRRRNQD